MKQLHYKFILDM